MRATLACLIAALTLAACGREATPGASAPSRSRTTIWTIATQTPPGTNPVAIQYMDTAAIQGRGVKRATTVAFISLPPSPTRFGLRMEIVNEFDCARRRVRPLSTTLATPDRPGVVNRENRQWVSVEGRPNVAPLYDFVCSDEDARAADSRFEHIDDTRPLDVLANAYFAAHPAGRSTIQPEP